MIPRERVKRALEHKETDKIPVDFGATVATGINVNIIYRLRQRFGLDAPGTPVKVIEPFQMLGEIDSGLMEIIGTDCVPLYGIDNFFGFKNENWKEWKLFDGTPVLVPGLFNTVPGKDGSIYQYPQGDKNSMPSGKMPETGYLFELIMRQEEIDESDLNIADNLEEFGIIPDQSLEHIKETAGNLYKNTEYGIFANLDFSAFGDIATVPGPALKRPKGIRDISEWYMSLVKRKEYVKKVFEGHLEIALENYKKLYSAAGDKILAIETSG